MQNGVTSPESAGKVLETNSILIGAQFDSLFSPQIFAKRFSLGVRPDKEDPYNYRPIAVLPTIAHVFEKLI